MRPLVNSRTNIRIAAENGISAVVVRSLFEEQILSEAQSLDDALGYGADINPEGLSYLPHMQHAGAELFTASRHATIKR